jgi:hypothetical protein
VERIRAGNLEHYTYRSLADQVAEIQRQTTAAASALRARGSAGGILPVLLRPPFHFLRHWVFRAGFLDGRAGFVMSAMRAFYVFLKYAKAWEMRRVAASSSADPDARPPRGVSAG